MPVIVPTDSVIMFTIEITLDAQQCLLTFPYVLLEDDLQWPDEAFPVADAFDELIVTPLMEQLSTDIPAPTILVQPVSPQRLRGVRRAASVGGGTIGTPLPSGAAVVVRRQGIEAGRRNQGRIYIPGVPAERVVNSQLTGGAVAGFGALVDNMKEDMPVLPFAFVLRPIVWAAPSADTTRSVFLTQVDPVIRYQRRREIGVGI